MERFRSTVVLAAVSVLVLFSSRVMALSVFRVESKSLPVRSVGNEVSILLDADQDVYGFSVSIDYDFTKIKITAIELGASAAAVSPEWNDGFADNGQLAYGVVFDLSGPTISKHMTAGSNLELLRLRIDVLAASETTALLDLNDVPGAPARLNVITDQLGDSVSPAPVLIDGTLNIVQVPTPIIEGYPVGKEGSAGDVFLICGTNFDQPGLRVRICDVEAQHTLLADNRTIQAIVPPCNRSGCVRVEVSTNLGTDVDEQGFCYVGGGGQFVRGDTNLSGDVDLSDAVGIFADLFLGEPAPATCRDALDANDDGAIDISDGVWILSFLFQGGPPVEPPFPNPGRDPTPDNIPDC